MNVNFPMNRLQSQQTTILHTFIRRLPRQKCSKKSSETCLRCVCSATKNTVNKWLFVNWAIKCMHYIFIQLFKRTKSTKNMCLLTNIPFFESGFSPVGPGRASLTRHVRQLDSWTFLRYGFLPSHHRAHVVTMGKLTWNLKMNPWKRRFLLETIIFRFHVSFRGGNFQRKQSTTPERTPPKEIPSSQPSIFMGIRLMPEILHHLGCMKPCK